MIDNSSETKGHSLLVRLSISVIGVLTLLLLISALSGSTRHDEHGETVIEVKESKITFYDLAREVQSDRVDGNKYECVYEHTLAPYRNVGGLKIMQIGLGCDKVGGPGPSMKLWDYYFEDSSIYFLDEVGSCGRDWWGTLPAHKRPTMLYENPGDSKYFKNIASQHGHWHIIVDDGEKTAEAQVTNFRKLFRAVMPGGVYIMENVAPGNDGGNSNLNDDGSEHAQFISGIFADSIEKRGLGKVLDRITCCDHICAFHRKPNP